MSINKAELSRKTGLPYHKIRKLSEEELEALAAAVGDAPPLDEPHAPHAADVLPDEEPCVRLYGFAKRQEGDTIGWALVEARMVPLDVIREHVVEVGAVRDLNSTIALIEERISAYAYRGE